VGLAAFVLLLCLLVGMLFPPLVGAVFLCYGLWWQGLAALVVWALVIWGWRVLRLGRFLEAPPSLL